MVTEGHGYKAQFVHPLGNDGAVGEVGLRGALPHIAGGKEYGVCAGILLKIGSKTAYTGL